MRTKGKSAKQRYQVSLEPRAAELLRSYGHGSISAGIERYYAENRELLAAIDVYEAALKAIVNGHPRSRGD